MAGRRGRLAGALVTVVALAVAPVAGCSAPVNTQGARIAHLTIDSRFVHGAMALTLVAPAAAPSSTHCRATGLLPAPPIRDT